MGGCVTATDISLRRLQLVKENAERINVPLKTMRHDWTNPNQDLPKFDMVLVDAPCSGSGVIRKHPETVRKRSQTVRNNPKRSEIIRKTPKTIRNDLKRIDNISKKFQNDLKRGWPRTSTVRHIHLDSPLQLLISNSYHF